MDFESKGRPFESGQACCALEGRRRQVEAKVEVKRKPEQDGETEQHWGRDGEDRSTAWVTGLLRTCQCGAKPPAWQRGSITSPQGFRKRKILLIPFTHKEGFG